MRATQPPSLPSISLNRTSFAAFLAYSKPGGGYRTSLHLPGSIHPAHPPLDTVAVMAHRSQVSSHHRTISSTSADEWQNGSIVEDFSDSIDPVSVSTNLPDWDAWQTGNEGPQAGPSSSPSRRRKTGNTIVTPDHLPASAYSHANQADEDFFFALERAGGQRSPAIPLTSPSSSRTAPSAAPSYPSMLTHPAAIDVPPQPPSPPIIDLRPEERRLRQREQSAGSTTEEEDWFAAFEKDPLSKSPAKGRSQSSMGQAQIDSMQEARDSPMIVPASHDEAIGNSDYFGSAAGIKQAKPAVPRPAQRGSRGASGSQASGSWWGSIRGLGSNLAQHAVDLMDPGVDFGDEELKIARKIGAIDISSKPGTPVISQSGTPIRGMTPVPPSAAAQSTIQQSDKEHLQHASARSASLPPSRFISGAPGVDFGRIDSHWNTGSWSLWDESATVDLGRNGTGASVAAAVAAAKKPPKAFRDPMEVHITGRTDETQPVITGLHSSHIQPYLPPRLKLGRTWRLLYSSDQDGVSLETLYHKVAIGMNPRNSGAQPSATVGRPPTRFNADRHDGWLRGSSSATKAALGSDLSTWSNTSSYSSASHGGLGGSGLTSIADAGLVLAIRDANDQVFGAFVNEGFKSTKSYYGNGDCFLWRTVQPREGTPFIKTYPTTLLNNYHILSTNEYLSLGGGIDGRYGLWIDSSFEKGVSCRSETYNNEVLCDQTDRSLESGKDEDERRDRTAERDKARGEVKFEPVIVEVWAVGID